jgi:hypothetical protein
MHRWRISRIRSTPAIEIGYVDAPDADQGVAEAIKQYGITRRAGSLWNMNVNLSF